MIEIQSLNKTFHRTKALNEISFTAPEGCSFALLGPNGSGKTTLLKALIGSVLPDPGSRFTLDGHSDPQDPEYKRKFVYMPQLPGFPPHLSPRETIALLTRVRNQEAPRMERLLEELKIQEFWDKPFRELSGGMRQKINILQCFMFDFQIAFLDEPTSSLDPRVALYLKNLIREIKSQGKTIMFTSHIMNEVEELADRMALFSAGSIYLVTEPAAFVREKNAKNLEEALLYYWREHES